MSHTDSFALIIFGITSNLAQKYLLRALYDMEEKGALPENISIIGNARRELSDEEFKKYIVEVLNSENIHHQHPIEPKIVEKLSKKMYYVDGYLDNPNFYEKLDLFLKDLDKKGHPIDNKIFYLAVYPDLYQSIFENLKKHQLTNQDKGWVRLMVEKPFGQDLNTASRLNKLLEGYFTEDQIYRLDHYLGKETLQNILTFRFGNGLFEPLINSEYVDHIQITALEDFGIGSRGGFYDIVGALKDVGQNHQLQMLAFTTMDSPKKFTNESITEERIKILKALKPHPKEIVFGQYEGYTEEKNISPTSTTETFYAFKTEVDNDRFKEVPIYVRAGKFAKKTVTEISIVFKTPQNRLFKDFEKGMEPNVLVYRLAPNEGIVMKILTKKPGGEEIELESEYMQYCYRVDPNSHAYPDPYDKLISDTIEGNQTFFNDAREVEAQWAFIDPLVKNPNQKPITYKKGSWGPKEADELIEKDGRKWLEPSEQFCRI